MSQGLCVSDDTDAVEVDDEPRAFADLDETTKAKALDANRDFAVSDDWWNSIYEDAERVGECLGVTFDRRTTRSTRTGKVVDCGPQIYFSGFWSQGDGASFSGTFKPRHDAVAAIAEHAPQDDTLKALAAECALIPLTFKLEKRDATVAAALSASGSYCHSGTMRIDCSMDDGSDVPDGLEDALLDLARRFADWIYAQLEAEHEYLTSDEYLTEYFSESDYRFDSDGRII